MRIIYPLGLPPPLSEGRSLQNLAHRRKEKIVLIAKKQQRFSNFYRID